MNPEDVPVPDNVQDLFRIQAVDFHVGFPGNLTVGYIFGEIVKQGPQGIPCKTVKMQLPVTGPWKDRDAMKRLQGGLKGTHLTCFEFMVLKASQANPFGVEIAVKILKSGNGGLLCLFNVIFAVLPLDMNGKKIGGKDETSHRLIFNGKDLNPSIKLDTLKFNTKFINKHYGIETQV
jgi:hypothetical protein